MDESIHYKLLKQLEKDPLASQRALAGNLGISLGKLNYTLRALTAKGWVKAGRFYRNPNKRKYAYLLTPQGIEAKARITARFLRRKMAEYNALRHEIVNLQGELKAAAAGRTTVGALNNPPAFALHHLGGETTVTGSCHLLQVNGVNILVDCGLVQGNDAAQAMDAWPVPPRAIDYLFLTHAHLDHAGRVPELVQKGFAGEIIATHATKALLAPMLADAMGLDGLTGKERRKLLGNIEQLSWGFEYGRSFELRPGIRFRLGRAGHILGSCFIRFEWDDPSPFSIIFSGDLGARHTPLLPDPDPPGPCDLLILEATYGDRLHEDRSQRLQQLGSLLSRALADKGKVFIPVFALGRTQELLYELDRLFTDPRWQKEFPGLRETALPVVVDSPLGLEITRIYSRLQPFWDEEARRIAAGGDHPLDFKGLYSARDHRDHLRLVQMAGPCVILAGSGMCTGGRIVNHLLAGLGDPRNDVVFVGYQAQGTPGRAILADGSRAGGQVFFAGKHCEIKARVHSLSGYSAHADQQGLIDWVESMPARPGAIKLVHGEAAARQALGAKLEEKGFNLSV